MGRSQIILFFILIIFSDIFSQGIYTPVEDNVYNFLENSYLKNYITSYNSFSLPLTRKEIANYLTEIRKISFLSGIDLDMLNYYEKEYTLELKRNDLNNQSIFNKGDFDIYNDNPKSIYHFYDSAKFSAQVNSILNIRYNSYSEYSNQNAILLELGGAIRGTCFERVGFYIQGTSGFFKGSKSAVISEQDLNYNFKITDFNESSFFDRAYGYLAFENEYLKLKIGSDRILTDYGYNKMILGGNSPKFNYLQINLKYKNFSYDFMHGWILGRLSFISDSIQGLLRDIPMKYIVKHQISFAPHNNLIINIGESVIYSGRSVELAYMNPFNFFKSTEHSLQDRDNTMLYTSLYYKPIKHFALYSTLLIDDLDFGKINSGWYGNQLAYKLGFNTSFLSEYYLSRLTLEYSKINPYVYSHRIYNNNYTNFDYPLGSYLQPNSYELLFNMEFQISPYFYFSLLSAYQKHGINYYNGLNIVNEGSDRDLGYRIGDPKKVYFLQGNFEECYIIKFNMNYEILKNVMLYMHSDLNYINSNKILFLTLGFISFI